MSTVGIIGAGAIGQAFARLALRAGRDVVLANSRRPATLGPAARALGPAAIPAAVADLGPWDGRIVIDTNNPIQAPDFVPADLGEQSSSEVVAALVPGARLVKTAYTLRPEVLGADPQVAGGRRVLFVAGDHPDANAAVAQLLRDAGINPIDLGDLQTGGRLLQFPGGPLPSLDLIRHG